MDFEGNFLSASNGALVLESSSSRIGCSANSLINNDKKIWASDEGLPQSIIIDISQLAQWSHFNYFAWYCWHSYTSNPSIIDLLVTLDYSAYKKWATFQANSSSGLQIFSIDAIPKTYKALKIVIRDTFGASNTYINKIYLFEKLPNSVKKNKNLDESLINISEISSRLNESPNFFDFNKNPKCKLKFQLEEMNEAVRNMQNKYEKFEELELVKEEVEDWGGKIYEINNNLKVLIEKVTKVEEDSRKLNNSKKIAEFKREIIDEIKNRKREQAKKQLENTSESKANDILSLIHIKTEAKLRKIRQLQQEKLNNRNK